MSKAKTKIAIVSHSLGSGGAERFAGELSCMLEQLGYEVHLVVVNDHLDFPYCGNLYNLGSLCKKDFGWLRKLKKGWLLRNYLDREKINVVIDNRTRNHFIRDWFSISLYRRRKTFYMIHSSYLQNYLPDSVFFARILYRSATKLICVSKAIESELVHKFGFNNTTTVYNPVKSTEIDGLRSGNLPKPYVLFYGRLEEKVKNFTLLLEAFSRSRIFDAGYELVIMGDGPSKDYIRSLTTSLKINDYVRLVPFQNNPFAYVKDAAFTILTSRYEGFPMSIIESLSIGTPVVAVDCQTGPAEIIQNEQNGILVENHNVEALAHAMHRMVYDRQLYDRLKLHTIDSVSHLSYEAIGRQWEKLLNENAIYP